MDSKLFENGFKLKRKENEKTSLLSFRPKAQPSLLSACPLLLIPA
jgi:hypothetical protein